MEWTRLRLFACLCLGTFLVSDPSAARLLSGNLLEATGPAESHDHCPCCPDDHKAPDAPKCPVPGGCALCNVARTPCTAPSAPSPLSAVCVGACDAERVSPYTSPAAARLIRPPRG